MANIIQRQISTYKINQRLIVFSAVGYAVAFFLFMVFALEGYTLFVRLLAWALFVIGSLPMAMYFIKRNTHIPIIELVILAYVNAFSLPVFYQDNHRISIKVLYPEHLPVAECLLYAIIGILALWIGFTRTKRFLIKIRFPSITLKSNQRKLFIYGCVLCLFSLFNLPGQFGALRNLANILISPDLGIAILGLCYYNGLSKPKKFITLVLLILIVLKGVASGMFQAMLQPLLIWYICRWVVTRKFELRILVAIVLLFILIQPVKLEYRELVWFGQVGEISAFEKVDIFVDIFSKHWLSDSKLMDKTDESTKGRNSLLLTTSHVTDWTPSIVPYKYGETLYAMFVMLIPRVIWPDKPTAQIANIEYAIQYGITTKRGTETAMFGVGHLGEAIMNFGGIGVFPLFFFLGGMYYLPVHLIRVPGRYVRTFQKNSGVNIASTALLVVLIIRVIFIGSTIANVFGSLVLFVLIQSIMLSIFTDVRKIRIF